jgi:dihydroorotase
MLYSPCNPMPSLLIQGGRVISPEDGLEGELDVLVEDGVIRQIGANLKALAGETLDARGQIVAPGFVDIHVHLREPGGEVSETLETGLRAAVAGGFTAVCPMPNTTPVIDSVELVRSTLEKAEKLNLARVFPIAAVSVGSQGESLVDMAALVQAGAVAFSDDGKPVKTAALMRRALETAQSLGVPVTDHCEEPTLSAGGVINEGAVSERLQVRGVPNSSEDVCVSRDLILAEAAGAHIHLAHLSTARAVEMVRAAKRRGIRATCEVTPHHFTLTEEAVQQYGTHAKMNPPLRSAQDVEAVLKGIAEGTVECIATDHAPHAPHLKAKPLAEAPNGVIGLETALPLALMRLVHSGRISLAHLIRLLSTNPARIINRPLGRLRAGGAADLTVFDPNREWTYRAAQGCSRSRNSPFDGWTMKGAVTATIVAGKVVYKS